MSLSQFDIQWGDAGLEPSLLPDPAYPEGIDLDVSGGRKPACIARLPYPARRIGYYLVECRLCHLRVVCTTAGRRDDPRSIKLACAEPSS